MRRLVPPDELEKVAEYTVSRVKLGVYGAGVGILLGVVNAFLDVDFTPRPALIGWLVAAIVLVTERRAKRKEAEKERKEKVSWP